MTEYPYRFHVALDGSGMNGLEGMAGICQFRFDPADNSYAYKICYYDGIAGGHAVSVNPGWTELTRILYWPNSSAATRTSWSTAALPVE